MHTLEVVAGLESAPAMRRTLGEGSLERLHRAAIHEPEEVRRFLEELRQGRVLLHNGMDGRNRLRQARVAWVESDRFGLPSGGTSRGDLTDRAIGIGGSLAAPPRRGSPKGS
jgi:hypothetical protein